MLIEVFLHFEKKYNIGDFGVEWVLVKITFPHKNLQFLDKLSHFSWYNMLKKIKKE
jgi:hypothetical protein